MSSFVSRYATTTCFKTDSDNNGGLHELKKMKVKVKSWTAVATWRWIANDDNCGICRMAFDGCCPDCKLPGDDCPLVWGQCSHCFHIHCIVKWLNSQQVHQLCPMCRQEWKFKE
ncbi:anaphase-promoting complex subunit 11 [Octopus sinensis]|uniref:Anaphase-promoting complex subunit 11 n=1 Tax=Octopus sinensis TaxID=2607531 RepID=A0A6P7T7X5_9MOLL|nr:anaphase-promoting complex subunit 11 [Octopus sinensis]